MGSSDLCKKLFEGEDLTDEELETLKTKIDIKRGVDGKYRIVIDKYVFPIPELRTSNKYTRESPEKKDWEPYTKASEEKIPKTYFGKLLRYYRKKARLSQTELAHKILMNPAHISRVERGERNPFKLSKITEVINVLDLTPEEADLLLISAGYAPKFIGNEKIQELYSKLKKLQK